MEERTKPNPGSEEAIRAGCRCPVLDNNRGKGIGISSDGETLFWMSGDCPIHGSVGSVGDEVKAS